MTQTYTYGDPLGARVCWAEDGSRLISFFIFNTDVHLHVYGHAMDDAAATSGMSALDLGGERGRERADEALLACRDRCVFFERTLSRTRSTSDISRAHACAPNPVDVSRETVELVELARGYCERSRGCFDITMGTVTRLWDFHNALVPHRLQLSRALGHVGVSRVRTSCTGDSHTLAIDDPETVLDLGGVAKGYIADDLAALLRAHGCARFVINLGGNVLVSGGRPADPSSRPAVRAGDPWRIGVLNPRDQGHYRAIVQVEDASVVTSGIAERAFARGGRTYHHILDPTTGMPAQTDCASATIVAPRSMDCDGYSTTVLMLGMEEGLEFAEETPGVEAVLIGRDDEVSWTAGVGEALSLVPTLPSLL